MVVTGQNRYTHNDDGPEVRCSPAVSRIPNGVFHGVGMQTLQEMEVQMLFHVETIAQRKKTSALY